MNYIQKVLATENKEFNEVSSRLCSESKIRILHGVIGVMSEGGELVDAVKKNIFYGRPLDTENLKEELGDMLYYMALVAHELGVSFEEIQQQNIAKLEQRYPGGFTEALAIERRDKTNP